MITKLKPALKVDEQRVKKHVNGYACCIAPTELDKYEAKMRVKVSASK